MADIAHEQTDLLIKKIERKIKKEYGTAQKEVEKKASTYFKKFTAKDKAKRALVEKGELAAEDYAKWRTQQMLVGKKWDALAGELAQDYANAATISSDIVKGGMSEAYALNHNFGTFQIETGAGVDTSYTLFSRETVERLLRDNPKLLPDPSKNIRNQLMAGKMKRWSKQKITSCLVQAILQGESIDKLAGRLRTVAGMNAASSVRNARTMMTNAQSAGRYDSYRRADKMGVDMKVMWVATLDDRTRHDHRMLDGQVRNIDEPFEVDGVQILYPADFGGREYKVPPDMIYNCRCTIIAVVKGTKLYTEGINSAGRVVGTGESYEEWQAGKQNRRKAA